MNVNLNGKGGKVGGFSAEAQAASADCCDEVAELSADCREIMKVIIHKRMERSPHSRALWRMLADSKFNDRQPKYITRRMAMDNRVRNQHLAGNMAHYKAKSGRKLYSQTKKHGKTSWKILA